MDKILHLLWCLLMPAYKVFLWLFKKAKFEFGSYTSYNCRFEKYNYIGRNSYVIKTNLGHMSYISRECYFYNTQIGKYTCIGPRVSVVCGRHPTHTFVSIHPAFFSKQGIGKKSYVKEQVFDEYSYADAERQISVIIGNDVWIGESALIMEGVTIGDGAIIAAGALVTKDVQPYSIVAGVPAQIKKYRFEPEIVRFLLDKKWWDQDEKWIKEHADSFKDIELFMKHYSRDE